MLLQNEKVLSVLFCMRQEQGLNVCSHWRTIRMKQAAQKSCVACFSFRTQPIGIPFVRGNGYCSNGTIAYSRAL